MSEPADQLEVVDVRILEDLKVLLENGIPMPPVALAQYALLCLNSKANLINEDPSKTTTYSQEVVLLLASLPGDVLAKLGTLNWAGFVSLGRDACKTAEAMIDFLGKERVPVVNDDIFGKPGMEDHYRNHYESITGTSDIICQELSSHGY